MKNLFIVFLTTLAISSYSQIVNLTPKIGFAYANFYWDRPEKPKFRPGLSAGLSTEYKISMNKYLESGLEWIQKGGVFSDEPNGFSDIKSTSNYTFNYVNIPVFLKIYLDKRNKSFFKVGLFSGYLVQATLRENISYPTGISTTKKEKEDLKQINRFDIGMGTGVGYRIKITTKNSLLMELRFDLSFSTQSKPWYSVYELRNINYLIYLGYEFSKFR
ncbi:MAG: PorT family protein [Bacteroidetes bacterium]|nr:PorT family protein [Bacteroidota bacterium]